MPISLSDNRIPKIGKRLSACAGLVGNCGLKRDVRTLADVGTDHGLLPVYLVGTGVCEKAYASDINPKPLESARRAVCSYGLSEKISVVLSDGLKNLPLNELTDVVCAGMGGELIVKILSEVSLPDGIDLVLQPMTKAGFLRKWLYDHDYSVDKEIAVSDGRFVYTVMRTMKRDYPPRYPCDLLYLYGGKIDPCSEDGARYFEITAARLRRAAGGMSCAGVDPDRIRLYNEAADVLESFRKTD